MRAALIVAIVLSSTAAFAQPPPPPPMPPGGTAVTGRSDDRGRDRRDDDGWRERERDRKGPAVVVSRPEMTDSITDAQRALADAMARLGKKDRKLFEALREAHQELEEARRDLAAAPTVRQFNEDRGRDRDTKVVVIHKDPPKPPEPPRVFPMEDFAFRQFLAAVDNEGFPQDKLRVIQQAGPTNWFLVVQVQSLLNRLSFPANKLDAMRVLKPRILDVENYYQLYGSFDFPSDKAELKRILGQ